MTENAKLYLKALAAYLKERDAGKLSEQAEWGHIRVLDELWGRLTEDEVVAIEAHVRARESWRDWDEAELERELRPWKGQ